MQPLTSANLRVSRNHDPGRIRAHPRHLHPLRTADHGKKVSLSVLLSICSFLHLSIYPPVYLTICLSVYLIFCRSVFQPFCITVPLSICLYVLLPFCLSVFLLICLTVCLSSFFSLCSFNLPHSSASLKAIHIFNRNCRTLRWILSLLLNR